jgi:predicted Abi (CAAX) family protease
MLAVLPFSLFVFPSLLEEAFFRGVLIPNDAASKGKEKIVTYVVISTAAAGIFLDPAFLLIVTLLSITCSVSYVFSRSLWAPIIIHWLTVFVWVVFLGGRNRLLDL